MAGESAGDGKGTMSDVPNWGDLMVKLLSYVGEELDAAKRADDHVIRMRHLERAQVFLNEANRLAEAKR